MKICNFNNRIEMEPNLQKEETHKVIKPTSQNCVTLESLKFPKESIILVADLAIMEKSIGELEEVDLIFIDGEWLSTDSKIALL